MDILIEVSLGISQSLQTNFGVILLLSHEDFLQPLAIHYSLIIVRSMLYAQIY
jgi:hypothetical protein